MRNICKESKAGPSRPGTLGNPAALPTPMRVRARVHAPDEPQFAYAQDRERVGKEVSTTEGMQESRVT